MVHSSPVRLLDLGIGSRATYAHEKEADAKGVAERLKKCDGGEVLAKAVGVTTEKGGLYRCRTMKKAQDVMGFPDFTSGVFLAAFSGVEAEMQVRRIEELVHREICTNFAPRLKLIDFCTKSDIPHNEMWECSGGLEPARPAAVLKKSKDRHIHWLDKAPGACTGSTRASTSSQRSGLCAAVEADALGPWCRQTLVC